MLQNHMAKHGLGVLLGTAYFFTGRAAAGSPESNVLALVVGILQNLSLHPANRYHPGSSITIIVFDLPSGPGNLALRSRFT